MARKQVIPDFVPVLSMSVFDFDSFSIFKQVTSLVN